MLFACFHEATMIAVADGSVEFEISMGEWFLNKGKQKKSISSYWRMTYTVE